MNKKKTYVIAEDYKFDWLLPELDVFGVVAKIKKKDRHGRWKLILQMTK